MTKSADERRQHFLDLAAAHADDFKTRVTQHDRENSFPHENMKAMRESGYACMPLPQEIGGGGADVVDFCLAQERLAYGDAPTAVAVNMHLLSVGALGDFLRLGNDGLRPFLETIARDRLIFLHATWWRFAYVVVLITARFSPRFGFGAGNRSAGPRKIAATNIRI